MVRRLRVSVRVRVRVRVRVSKRLPYKYRKILEMLFKLMKLCAILGEILLLIIQWEQDSMTKRLPWHYNIINNTMGAGLHDQTFAMAL